MAQRVLPSLCVTMARFPNAAILVRYIQAQAFDLYRFERATTIYLEHTRNSPLFWIARFGAS